MHFLLPSLSWAFQPLTQNLSLAPILLAGRPINLSSNWVQETSRHLAGPKFVVYIQDLHCHYEVQSHIASFLKDLQADHGVALVGLEGAAKTVNPWKLSSFPMNEVKEEVADYFMRQGYLSGAEKFAATARRAVRLQGVEDPELYRQNQQSVTALLKSEAQGLCLDLREALESLKPRLYETTLTKFDQLRSGFRQGALPPLAYARGLLTGARIQGVELNAYPVLTAYVQRSNDPAQLPEGPDRLFREMEGLDRAIRDTLYTSPAERALDQQLSRLDLIEKLLNISATEEEVKQFRQDRKGFSAQAGWQFLVQQGSEADLAVEARTLDRYLDLAEEFYRVADLRGQALARNLVADMVSSRQELAVLISGGYHGPAVLEELKRSQVSFVAIKPRLTQWDSLNPYFDRLTGREAPLEKLLAQTQKRFAFESYLPQSESSDEVRTGQGLPRRVAVFGRWLDLMLKVRAGFALIVRGMRGPALMAAQERLLASYPASDPSIACDLARVATGSQVTVHYPVQAGERIFEAIAWESSTPAPVRTTEAVEVASLGRATFALVEAQRAGAVLARLNAQLGWGRRTWQAMLQGFDRWSRSVRLPWLTLSRSLRFPVQGLGALSPSLATQTMSLADTWQQALTLGRGSPDMGGAQVAHQERNQRLADQIRQGRVYRLTAEGPAEMEPFRSVRPGWRGHWETVLSLVIHIWSWFTGLTHLVLHASALTDHLQRLRAPGASLEQKAAEFPLEAVAAAIGLSVEDARARVLELARNTDVLLVRGRLTLHDTGPWGHARTGLTRPQDRAIWLGERLFDRPEVTDDDLAQLLLEEAQHLLAPSLGHDIIQHDPDLAGRLAALTAVLGETPVRSACVYDPDDRLDPAVRTRITELQRLRQAIALDQVRRTANVFDVHGDPQALDEALAMVHRGEVDQIIFHGDAFERGDRNLEVYQRLRDMKAELGDRFILIMGNHDLYMIEALLLGDRENLKKWISWEAEDLFREVGLVGIKRRMQQIHEESGDLGVDAFLEDLLEDPRLEPLKQAAEWMFQNQRLYFLDGHEVLHVHAGIPMDENGQPQFTRADLVRSQALLETLQAKRTFTDPDRAELKRLLQFTRPLFELRGDLWLNQLLDVPVGVELTGPSPELREQLGNLRSLLGKYFRQTNLSPQRTEVRIRSLLPQLLARFGIPFTTTPGRMHPGKPWNLLNAFGIQGVMVGHHHDLFLVDLDHRIFGGDQEQQTILVTDHRGTHYHFRGREPRTLIDKAAVLARIDAQIQGLRDPGSLAGRPDMELALVDRGPVPMGVVGGIGANVSGLLDQLGGFLRQPPAGGIAVLAPLFDRLHALLQELGRLQDQTQMGSATLQLIATLQLSANLRPPFAEYFLTMGGINGVRAFDSKRFAIRQPGAQTGVESRLDQALTDAFRFLCARELNRVPSQALNDLRAEITQDSLELEQLRRRLDVVRAALDLVQERIEGRAGPTALQRTLEAVSRTIGDPACEGVRSALQEQRVPSAERPSPDMSAQVISHAERNQRLAENFLAAKVFRLSAQGQATHEVYDPSQTPVAGITRFWTWVRSLGNWLSVRSYARGLQQRIVPELDRIRGPDGYLELAIPTLDLTGLAAHLGTSLETTRARVIAAARQADVLLVRDRLTLHPGGSFAHARVGLSRPGQQAIWLGEKLFTQGTLSDLEVAQLLLEEAQHLVAPEADHSVIRHSEELRRRLTRAAQQLRELPMAGVCERDIADIEAERTAQEGTQARHTYTHVMGQELGEFWDRVDESWRRGALPYAQRFRQGIEAARPEVATEFMSLEPNTLTVFPVENRGRVFRDEDGVYWIARKYTEVYDSDEPKRERLGYLLSRGIANFTEIRPVSPENAAFVGWNPRYGRMRQFYLTRVVALEPRPKLSQPLERKAFAANFVLNVFLRKIDPHPWNVSFAHGVPVAIDHEAILNQGHNPHTLQGFGQFVASWLLNSLFVPLKFWSKRPKELDRLINGNRYAGLEDERLEDIVRLMRQRKVAAGFMAAEMLREDEVREAIQQVKEVSNLRELAQAAGYEGEALEAITVYLTQSQSSLGRDLDKLWDLLTGHVPGFGELDLATETAIERASPDMAPTMARPQNSTDPNQERERTFFAPGVFRLRADGSIQVERPAIAPGFWGGLLRAFRVLAFPIMGPVAAYQGFRLRSRVLDRLQVMRAPGGPLDRAVRDLDLRPLASYLREPLDTVRKRVLETARQADLLLVAGHYILPGFGPYAHARAAWNGDSAIWLGEKLVAHPAATDQQLAGLLLEQAQHLLVPSIGHQIIWHSSQLLRDLRQASNLAGAPMATHLCEWEPRPATRIAAPVLPPDTRPFHRYTQVGVEEERMIWKEVEQNWTPPVSAYLQRLVDGFRRRVEHRYAADFFPQVPTPRLNINPSATLLKDEAGDIWLVKREDPAGIKDDPRRERLGDLLAQGRANFAEVRSLTAAEARGLDFVRSPADRYYLVRVVKAGNHVVLYQTDPARAAAFNFVVNLWMRKMDPHPWNQAFLNGVPIELDHDYSLRPEQCPPTPEGFKQFMTYYVLNVVLVPLGRWSQASATALETPTLFRAALQAQWEAQGLDPEHLRAAVETIKGVKDLRRLAQAAGYENEEIDEIASYLEQNQWQLGTDLDRFIKYMTGENANYAVLDGAQVVRRGSPDLASLEVTHAERNRWLERNFRDGRVFRLSPDQRVALEPYRREPGWWGWWNALWGKLAHPHAWLTAGAKARTLRATVANRLTWVRDPQGPLATVAGQMDLTALATYLGEPVEGVRERLIAAARSAEVLLVRGRFTLHPRGPFAHARVGLTRPGDQAIWLGERLFQSPGLGDQDIAGLLLEEAQHLLAPEAGHDVIRHAPRLLGRLRQAARGVGEAAGSRLCARDILDQEPGTPSPTRAAHTYHRLPLGTALQFWSEMGQSWRGPVSAFADRFLLLCRAIPGLQALQARVNDLHYTPDQPAFDPEVVYQDEAGDHWILKNFDFTAPKNIAARERLVYLLGRGIGNLAEIRTIAPSEAPAFGMLAGPLKDHYLSRAVRPGNHVPLTHMDPADAVAAHFVLHVWFGKIDPHPWNQGFIGQTPVEIDHDMSLNPGSYPPTTAGMEDFIENYLLNAVFLPLRRWSTGAEPFLHFVQHLQDTQESTVRHRRSIDFLRKFPIGRAYVQAMGLSPERIERALRACQAVTDIREQAAAAGYRGEQLERIVTYLEAKQARLGQDADALWRTLTGQELGWENLDQRLAAVPAGVALPNLAVPAIGPNEIVSLRDPETDERYTRVTGPELERFWEVMRHHWVLATADYTYRFFAAARRLAGLQAVVPRPGGLTFSPERRGYEHFLVFKDGAGTYWVGREPEVAARKMNGTQERLAYLLGHTWSNVAEAKVLRPVQMERSGPAPAGMLPEYTLTRAVRPDNRVALVQTDARDAAAANLVLNVLMRKTDAHPWNKAFLSDVPVALDAEMGFNREAYPATPLGFRQFLAEFLVDVVLNPLKEWSLQPGPFELAFLQISLAHGQGQMVPAVEQWMRAVGPGPAFVAAEQLEPERVARFIRMAKQPQDLRALAAAAGYHADEVDAMAGWLKANQSTLGHDLNTLWQQLTGVNAGFDRLDAATVPRVRGSPDLGSEAVAPESRDQIFEERLSRAEVYRIGLHGKIERVRLTSKSPSTTDLGRRFEAVLASLSTAMQTARVLILHQSVWPRLRRVRALGGPLEQAVVRMNLQLLAKELKLTVAETRERLVAVARKQDLLLVPGRLTLFSGGPFVHARLQLLPQGDTALYLGELLFTRTDLEDEEIARVMLEVSQHLLAPNLAHPLITHSPRLLQRLQRSAEALNEVPGALCEWSPMGLDPATLVRLERWNLAHRYMQIRGEEGALVLDEMKVGWKRVTQVFADRFLRTVRAQPAFSSLRPDTPELQIKPRGQNQAYGFLFKDENGEYWLVKQRGYFDGYDPSFSVSPSREQLAFLLARGIGNFADTRPLQEEETQDMPFLDQHPSSYYMVRAVFEGNRVQLSRSDPIEAAHANFVLNIWMRKLDPHPWNSAYVGEVPVEIDPDLALDAVHYSRTPAGLEDFITHYFLNTLLLPLSRWTKKKQPFEDLIRAVSHAPDQTTGARLMREFMQKGHPGQAIIAGWQLEPERIRHYIRLCKDKQNLRELAYQAGYRGETLERITAFLKDNQTWLGTDIDRVWEGMTGTSVGFGQLDRPVAAGAKRESPDLVVQAAMPVTHEERNAALEQQFYQAQVFRVRPDGKVAREPVRRPKTWWGWLWLGLNQVSYATNWAFAAVRATEFRTTVGRCLARLRTPGGTLEQVAAQMQVDKLAAYLSLSPDAVRARLVEIARQQDLLIVRGRLTLHSEGPLGHARVGRARAGDTAIWLGEKLFTFPSLSDADVAGLILEEAQHILAPDADHAVILHSDALLGRLRQAAMVLDEVPGERMCERDASGRRRTLTAVPSAQAKHDYEVVSASTAAIVWAQLQQAWERETTEYIRRWDQGCRASRPRAATSFRTGDLAYVPASRGFAYILLQDESGAFWLVKRPDPENLKNDPRREVAGYLVAADLANAAEVRRLTPEEKAAIPELAKFPGELYLSQLVMPEGGHPGARPLVQKGIVLAQAANLVMSFVMRRGDPFIWNTAFQDRVPVMNDFDWGVDPEIFPATPEGLDHFCLSVITNAIFFPAIKWSTDSVFLAMAADDIRRIPDVARQRQHMQALVQRYGLGQGFWAAEHLDQGAIEAFIRLAKAPRDFRAIVIAAGYQGQPVDEMTAYFEANQRTLGADLNYFFRIILGRDLGLDRLDREGPERSGAVAASTIAGPRTVPQTLSESAGRTVSALRSVFLRVLPWVLTPRLDLPHWLQGVHVLSRWVLGLVKVGVWVFLRLEPRETPRLDLRSVQLRLQVWLAATPDVVTALKLSPDQIDLRPISERGGIGRRFWQGNLSTAYEYRAGRLVLFLPDALLRQGPSQGLARAVHQTALDLMLWSAAARFHREFMPDLGTLSRPRSTPVRTWLMRVLLAPAMLLPRSAQLAWHQLWMSWAPQAYLDASLSGLEPSFLTDQLLTATPLRALYLSLSQAPDRAAEFNLQLIATLAARSDRPAAEFAGSLAALNQLFAAMPGLQAGETRLGTWQDPATHRRARLALPQLTTHALAIYRQWLAPFGVQFDPQPRKWRARPLRAWGQAA